MNPKVSVILTTHGEGKYLNQAIASVLAQTFTDFHLHIARDGHGVVHYPRDPRIGDLNFDVPDRTINRFAYTINQAFLYCRGDYITYLCHDDLYLPYRLDVMVRVIEELKLDIVFGNQQTLDETSGAWWGPKRIGSMQTPNGTVDHSSVMHKRECFERVGGWDESAPMRYGDAYFWKRLVDAGYKFNGIDEVLDVHRFNSDSVTWKEDNVVTVVENKCQGRCDHMGGHPMPLYPEVDDMGNKRTINNAVDAGWSAVEK